MTKVRKPSVCLDPTRKMLSELGRVFCIMVIFISAIILLLREFNYSFLLKITPDGSIVQDVLASICFIISGVVLYILRNEVKYTKLKKIIAFIPLVISFIGVVELYVFFVEVFFKSDVPLIYVVTKEGIEIVLGRMAPYTSLCFILLGISIFYIDTPSERKKRIMQFFNYAIVLIALLSIYGYIYNVEPLYYTGRTVLMSFHSSICLFLISSAVLFLRPERGSMQVLIGESPTEVILLRFTALVLPLLFGWIKLKGERAGWYDSEFGTTMFAVANFIIIMFFLGRKSTVQYRLRRARAKIQEIIKRDNEKLTTILDSSPTSVSIYDLETDRIIYINKMEELKLSNANAILDIPVQDFVRGYIYRDDIPKVLDRINEYKSFKDKVYYPIEYRYHDPNGNIHWLHARATVYKRVDGEVRQILTNSIEVTEQKRAEEELEESRQFIHKVTKASANIIYILDLGKYEIIYANRFMETLMGYTKEEVEALGSELLYSLIHPEDIDKLGKYYEEFKYAKDDEVREIEYRMKHKLGNWIWLYSRDTVFKRDGNRLVNQIVGIAHDVTIRKGNELQLAQKNQELGDAYGELYKAQYELKEMNSELEEKVNKKTKDLQESEERYKAYINQSNEGIWRNEFKEILYIDTNLPLEEQVKLFLKYAFIAECNNRLAKLRGFEASSDLVGMAMRDFSIVDEEEQIAIITKFMKADYCLTDIETSEVIKQGTPKHFRSSVIGIVKDGKLLRIWGTQQDVTAQKIAEAAVKESEKRFHLMVDRIPEIFWCGDAEGKVQYYNEKWHDYTRETDEHKLKEWILYVHNDDVSRVLDLWKDCVKNSKECSAEYRLRRYDGVYRWHLIRAMPMKNEKGEVVNWMSTSTDIHTQKINSKILAHQNENLTKAAREASNHLEDTISSIKGLISIHDDNAAELEETTKITIDKLKRIISGISEAGNFKK